MLDQQHAVSVTQSFQAVEIAEAYAWSHVLSKLVDLNLYSVPWPQMCGFQSDLYVGPYVFADVAVVPSFKCVVLSLRDRTCTGPSRSTGEIQRPHFSTSL